MPEPVLAECFSCSHSFGFRSIAQCTPMSLAAKRPDPQIRPRLAESVGVYGLIVLAVALSGCAAFPGRVLQSSGIDADYRISRLTHSSEFHGTRSPGISFYQKVLSQTLGSHCSMYPSDSAYAQNLSVRCGPAISIFRAMARFYLEPDAATLGTPILVRQNRILYEDLPGECSLL